MNRLRVVACSLISASALWLANAGLAAASTVTLPDKVTPIPEAVCADILTMVKHNDLLSAGQKAQAHNLTNRDCYVQVRGGNMSLPTAATTRAYASSGCRGYYGNMDIHSGPLIPWTVHVNVGMCWNGSTAWKDWGPDCPITTLPGFGGDVSWCGVYHNNTWDTQPGANFDIFAWSMPWYKRYGWMRFDVYYDGTASSVWGGCCS